MNNNKLNTDLEDMTAELIMPEEEKETIIGEEEPTISNGIGVYIHKFKNPFKYEEKTYKTLKFYFDRLTGKDMINVETEMQDKGEYAMSPEYSRIFQAMLASKASGVSYDVLKKMPLGEFNRITNVARNFLLK